jgi:multiple sugar transport system ATP-binding protein
MDEPISHLDAKLRTHMRGELKHLQKELNQTFIYVTHDQLEAMAMADRIAVMNIGEIRQYDTPYNIFNHPTNKFVAGFVGDPPMNFIRCNLVVDGTKWMLKHEVFELTLTEEIRNRFKENKEFSGSIPVILGIRPDSFRIKVTKENPEDIKTEIYITEPLGSDVIVDVLLGGEKLKIRTPFDFRGDRGDTVYLEMITHRIHLFDRETENSLLK